MSILFVDDIIIYSDQNFGALSQSFHINGRIELICILWSERVGDNNLVIKSELIQMRHSPEKRMEMQKHRRC